MLKHSSEGTRAVGGMHGRLPTLSPLPPHAFQAGAEFLGFFLGDSFLDLLRNAIHQRFRVLQSEPSNGPHFLDNRDLLASEACEG